ncbi:uncharacterized protein [Battus philenor]|uniref:uncharacterized protein n=1 Tax=Battus philenor TaxID=42288 RepID=UPI0035D13632
MDLTVDEYLEGLFSKEAHETPSDSVKEEDLEMKLPKWFDEDLFNRSRTFFFRFIYGLTTVPSHGLIIVFSVPSILKILVNSQRTSSKYTAYRRYVSTLMHMLSWFKYELKPGSVSWKSLEAVRTRHLRASRSAQMQNVGTVSQRDLALTQFGFIGFAVLMPDRFGVRQVSEGDWEAYNHFWKVIGHMIGIEDRYNLCRNNIEETRKVCQYVLDRVFTPCLENVPEYFEHMCRVMMDGLWAVNPVMESGSMLYLTKNLCNVPGYILTEAERISLQSRIKEQLNGKHEDIGVDSSLLVQKSKVEGLPQRAPLLLFLKDYETLDNSPEYRKLSIAAKYKIAIYSLTMNFYTTSIGRMLINIQYILSLIVADWFPYVAVLLYGFKNAYVDKFKESIKDKTVPRPNADYYKPQPPEPWYRMILRFR